MGVQGDLFSSAPPAPAAPPVVVTEPAPVAAPTGPPTLTLIDASGFVFRAYHALPPLTTSKGVPTHAVLGFTRMLLKLLRERRPTHLALCFDKDSRKGRLAIDPNYKANREAPPADLSMQFELIRKVAAVLDIPILEVAGWEADDVIATLVKRARAEGLATQIVTSDKDFLQLLAPDVSIWDPVKDSPIGEAEALEKFGVPPSQMREYQALVGDAIDNVPKVPGVGPKTAAELVKRFGTVEALIARADEIEKPKLRAAIKEHVEQLRRAYQLVSFRDDLELDASPTALGVRPIHQAEARALFTELEFYRLIGEMPAAEATPLTRQATLVTDEAGLSALTERLLVVKRLALAPVFEGEPHSATVVGLGLALVDAGVFYVDVRACGASAVATALKAALARADCELAAHDAKGLLHVLARLGVVPKTLWADLELLSYLTNPSRKEHALVDLARERLRQELPTVAALLGGREHVTISQLEAVQLGPSFGAAADAIARLSPDLWTEVEGVGLATVARTLEFPLIPLLVKLEQAGVLIDRDALAEISKQVDASCEALLQDVYRHAGREFNVGSPAQLAQVLFDDLKLPILKRNKTGPSTDHEVLEKLAEEHPLPRAIIEYRNVSKLKSTYLDTLPTLIGADGRVRTTFHQAATATGRLSSTNPNLQNIPVRTELGRQIRRAFVAAPGHVLLSADYSQVELRILAHMAQDEALVRAFAEAADVHARTAAEVFQVPETEVTADMRRAAKMVNYGIAYGLSPHGLSTRLNIPVDEAKSIIDRYFARFPGIAKYIDDTVAKAKKSGFVESLFGRRRYMPDISSRNRSIAMAAERAAINMPIQATAADLVKRAMLEADRVLGAKGLGTRMLLQVHDELLFEVPEGELEQVTPLVREVMVGAASLVVPLVVDVGHGRSWADAH
ncbi:MAG: DNA polymerase I [Myxococcaceae bacterium]|nr:DNA polymerase I [Myxococcaceae bacterium]